MLALSQAVWSFVVNLTHFAATALAVAKIAAAAAKATRRWWRGRSKPASRPGC